MFNDDFYRVVNDTLFIIRFDKSGKIIYTNEKINDAIDCPINYLKNKHFYSLRIKDANIRDTFKDIIGTVNNGDQWNGVISMCNCSRKDVYIKTSVIRMIQDGNVEFVALGVNVTEMFEIRKELEDTQLAILQSLAVVGERKSDEIGEHVIRVSNISILLGKLLGLRDDDLELLEKIAPLHDIGKIGIPDAILEKPGALTEEEFDLMKGHAETGYDMLKNSPINLLRVAADIAHDHHENWDGTGYPRGIDGKNITLFGRIVGVADVFDALKHKRCYKDAWTDEQIKEFFLNQRGKKFDPILVDLFLDHYEDFNLLF